MTDKITKLKEIEELLKSGTINQEDFDKLKTEILNSQQQESVTPKTTTTKPFKEKYDGFALATLLFGVAGLLAVSELNIQILIGVGVFAFIGSIWRFNVTTNLKGKALSYIGLVIVLLNAGLYLYGKNADDSLNLNKKGAFHILIEPEAGVNRSGGIK